MMLVLHVNYPSFSDQYFISFSIDSRRSDLARKFFSSSTLKGMGVSRDAHLITGASSHSKQ